MIYTVTFNPALDYVMKVEKLRFDDINRTYGEELSYGGKGINVSVLLSRLGKARQASRAKNLRKCLRQTEFAQDLSS